LTDEEIAGRIQHTNVRPDATRADVERLLDDCRRYRFHGAMVNPIWVPLAVRALTSSGVRVCTALDFPIGGGTTASVAHAAAEARDLGADEIDVMTKVGWLKSELDAEYREHLAAVVKAADGAPVKAMLEAVYLTAEELARAVELCAEAGIAYLKNSSGFDGGSASPEIVEQLVRLSRGRMKVKASGGIRTRDQAVALVETGADLLGSSAGPSIIGKHEAPRGEQSY